MKPKDPMAFRDTISMRFGEFNGQLGNANDMIVVTAATQVRNKTASKDIFITIFIIINDIIITRQHA